ncbi:MAG TPA: wax ester/triacylglycerol synthase family O-acyltransferase [Acidisphaera sp.]|nr:wax ester/triacylglycerol synthase family O-acyltransferase [Acidisphaera sp.]
MTPVDTAWLRMNRPNNPMMIVGVMKLEGPVDTAKIEALISERLLRHSRFRQFVDRTAIGWFWTDDPHFELGRHVRRVRLPAPGGKAELETFVAELASQPLDPNRPLWQFHLVEDYEGGIAVVSRIHHAIADGIALVRVMMSIMDEANAAHGLEEILDGGEGGVDAGLGLGSLVGSLSSAVGQSMRMYGSMLRLATNPLQMFDYARTASGFASEFAWLLFMPTDTKTRLKGTPSGNKRVAWGEPIPLSEVKAVGHALGCSVNDVVLCAVAGALRGYLASKGDAVDGVDIRALVPVNLRPADEPPTLGNRFGIVGVLLPVGIAHPLERLYEVRRRMEELKSSYEPPATLMLIASMGLGPKLLQDQLFDLLTSRSTAVMTNVPGPQRPLHIGGCRVRDVISWVPQSCDLGLGLSILSFDGTVQFGVTTDAALVPDPDEIVKRFLSEFEAMLYSVLLDAKSHPAQPQLESDSAAKAASSRSISSEAAHALASE